MNPVILYDSIFLGSEVAADQEATGFDDDNIADLRPWKRWKGTSSANQNIDITLSGSAAADAIGFAGHNLGTASANLLLQYDDSGWNTVLNENFLDDKPKLFLFNSQSSDKWRLVLSTMTDTPEIGVLIVGPRLTMETALRGAWNPNADRAEVVRQNSQTGNLLQKIVRFREQNLVAQFRPLTDTWFRANIIPAWEHLHKDPFFFAWDYDRFPNEIHFGDNPNPSLDAAYDPVRRIFRLPIRALVE